MQYGHFDELAREYVITNPNTPAPWANYLGSPDYGAIITVNAGGYSFVKSGANGRIIRYRFNESQISSLNKIKWWNWDYELIKERFDDFLLDIDDFIEKYEG